MPGTKNAPVRRNSSHADAGCEPAEGRNTRYVTLLLPVRFVLQYVVKNYVVLHHRSVIVSRGRSRKLKSVGRNVFVMRYEGRM